MPTTDVAAETSDPSMKKELWKLKAVTTRTGLS